MGNNTFLGGGKRGLVCVWRQDKDGVVCDLWGKRGETMGADGEREEAAANGTSEKNFSLNGVFIFVFNMHHTSHNQ